MATKIYQLDMFNSEKETFEQITNKCVKALFVRDNIREKDMKNLKELIFEMHEIVLRMNDRLNRVVESTN
jgi:hypothetical protein